MGLQQRKKLVIELAILVVLLILLSVVSLRFSVFNSYNGFWNYANTAVLGNGTFYVPGLYAPVEIVIDSSGVAHIYAENAHDLFFAEGYYTASQRLFEMELFGLLASGNLSSWFGEVAVNSDIRVHLIGIPQNALMSMKYVEEHYPIIYSYLEAYSQGVNAYIAYAERHHELPFEFYLLGIKPYNWTPYYSFAWGEFMAWSLTSGFCEELQASLLYAKLGFNLTNELWPYYPYFTNGSITVMPGDGTVNGYSLTVQGIDPNYLWSLNWYAEWATGVDKETLEKNLPLIIEALRTVCSDPPIIDLGSNSWIVVPPLSPYPMMANDPHLNLYAPSLWLPIQLVGGGFNVTGWELVGIPGVLIGHTATTAWGLTTPMGASSNAYLEIVNMTSKEYLFNGTWYRLGEFNFTVLGKTYTVYYTNNGPLVVYNESSGYGISLYWTAWKYPLLAVIAEMLFDNSTDFEDLINAAHYWVIPPQNVAMVSRNHAAIITDGLYPLIKEVLPNGQVVYVIGSRGILNGTVPNYEPVGYVPFEYLPQAIDPLRGFAFAPNQPTAWINYPYPFIGGYWVSPGRALDIYHYISTRTSVDVTDMEKLQSSVWDSWASMLTPLIIKCLSNESLVGIYKEAYDELLGWNYTFYQGEVAPTIYAYTVSYMINNFLNPIYEKYGLTSIANLLPFYGEDTVIVDDITYLGYTQPSSPLFNGSFCSLVNSSFTQAVNDLKNHLGANVSDWTWGRVHMLMLYNPTGVAALSVGPIPLWGSSFTLAAGYYILNASSVPLPYTVVGPSLRIIAVPSLGEYYGVFPGGPSENPASPWFETQLNAWLNFQYYPLGPVIQPVVVWYLKPLG